MAGESIATSLRHIARVRELLGTFAIAMIRRGDVHDASKFDPIEQGPLDEMQRLIEVEGQAPFGSAEYNRRTNLLGEMIIHHRGSNDHHPEHWLAGVADMDLECLVEMFFDWKAASERGGADVFDLSKGIKKYGIEPQLAAILKNTAVRRGWRVK